MCQQPLLNQEIAPHKFRSSAKPEEAAQSLGGSTVSKSFRLSKSSSVLPSKFAINPCGISRLPSPRLGRPARREKDNLTLAGWKEGAASKSFRFSHAVTSPAWRIGDQPSSNQQIGLADLRSRPPNPERAG